MKHRYSLLAFASGLVFAASTPPINFQPGILIGLIGFAFVLIHDEQAFLESGMRLWRRGMFRGFLFGFGANLLALRFVPEVMQRFTPLPAIAGYVALVLLAAGQSVPWVIGGAVARWLMHPRKSWKLDAKRSPAPTWLAFAVGVYVALFIPALFPWTPAGGLSRWPILIQTAELVGERGTSFIVAIVCGLFAIVTYSAIEHRRLERGAIRFLGIGAGIVVVLLVYGAIRTSSVNAARDAATHVKVALLQPDFDATMRWEDRHAGSLMDRLTTLTKRAEEEGAQLTVWPESGYPYPLAHGAKQSPRGSRAVLQRGVHGPVLTGAYMSKGGGLGTNAAILVEPNGDITAAYDKRHLLWFGETVPFADVFPYLRQVFSRGTGLVAGTETVAFKTGPIVAAVLNCYEDTLPAAGREAMEVRPNLLVNITNDAWFAGSAEGELHLRLAVLRAIETRRDLVRSVNRGPTTFVDATGRIVGRREGDASGLGPPPPLLADVALLESPITLYTRAGDLPLIVLLVAAIVLNARRKIELEPAKQEPTKQ